MNHFHLKNKWSHERGVKRHYQLYFDRRRAMQSFFVRDCLLNSEPREIIVNGLLCCVYMNGNICPAIKIGTKDGQKKNFVRPNTT